MFLVSCLPTLLGSNSLTFGDCSFATLTAKCRSLVSRRLLHIDLESKGLKVDRLQMRLVGRKHGEEEFDQKTVQADLEGKLSTKISSYTAVLVLDFWNASRIRKKATYLGKANVVMLKCLTGLDDHRWLDVVDDSGVVVCQVLLRLSVTPTNNHAGLFTFDMRHSVARVDITEHLQEIKGRVKATKEQVLVRHSPLGSPSIDPLHTWIRHPFLWELKAYFEDGEERFHVFPVTPTGTLASIMRHFGRFSEERARFYLAQIVLFLVHIHKRKIIFGYSMGTNRVEKSTPNTFAWMTTAIF